MKEQHSPGPWYFKESCISSFIVDAEGSIVAGGEPYEGYLGADDPNAVLMCAAPELLAHLKFAVALISAMPLISGTAQVEAMRAAIAKATGSQP